MSDQRVDVERLTELLAKATPGRWRLGSWAGRCHKHHPATAPYHPGSGGSDPCQYEYAEQPSENQIISDGLVTVYPEDSEGNIRVEDLALIAAMHEALPALLLQLAAREAEVARLRGFAKDVMESWPDGDVDGGYLQEAAEKAGLLRVVTLAGSCGEDCSCNEFFREGEARECYRKTSLLTGKPESDSSIAAFLAANGGA